MTLVGSTAHRGETWEIIARIAVNLVPWRICTESEGDGERNAPALKATPPIHRLHLVSNTAHRNLQAHRRRYCRLPEERMHTCTRTC